MDSLCPPRLGFVSASAIRIRLVPGGFARCVALYQSNPCVFARSSVGFLPERARSAACRGAGGVYFPRNSRVPALLAPGAALGGLELRVRTVSWVCVIWRAMRKQSTSQPGALFLRMWAWVVADQNLSGFGQITVDVAGC